MLGAGLFLGLVLLVSSGTGDDGFTCCMGGWKVVRGVTLCRHNCCHGYEERVLPLPLLLRPVVCAKLTEEQITQQIEARLAAATTTTTTTIVPPVPVMPQDSLRYLRELSEITEELLGRDRQEKKEAGQRQSSRERSQRALHAGGRLPRDGVAAFEAVLQQHSSTLLQLLHQGVPVEDMMAALDTFLSKLQLSLN